MFRKVLFMWSSMPILRFIGYTLTELFRKPDNWQQIYKQTSSTFYTSSNASRRKNLLVRHYRVAKKLFNNSFKDTEAATGGVLYKKAVLKNFSNFTGKHPCWSLFFNKVAGLKRLKCFSTQVLSCEVCETFKNTYLTLYFAIS